MANISASTILYSAPLVTKLGGLLFTATNIEVPSTATEYVEGGIELLPAKLGLSDEAIAGIGSIAQTEPTIGGLASTSALPAAIWTSGVIATAKTVNEAQKEVKVAFTCSVASVAGVPYLRCYTQTTAGQEKPLEEIKVKTSLSLCATTIFALGK